MKDFINMLLRKTVGYQVVRFDPSGYAFRERLAAFIKSNEPHGKILDIGSSRESYLKKHYANVTTLDLEPPADDPPHRGGTWWPE